ncbi:uncharacterized protein [Ptychodera flava]|uniref:uncharacterized protein isoform X2 n=1 Tax=Ptychodera flava TaxID=63121 RepID=UPI00396A6CBF
MEEAQQEGAQQQPVEAVAEGQGAASAASDSLAAATSISVLENYLQNFSKELSSEQQAEGAIAAQAEQQASGDGTAATVQPDASTAEQEDVTQTLQLLANASAEIAPPVLDSEEGAAQHQAASTTEGIAMMQGGEHHPMTTESGVTLPTEGVVGIEQQQVVMVGDMHPPTQQVLMVAMQQDPNAPTEQHGIGQIAVSEVPAGLVGQTAIYQTTTDTGVTQTVGQNTQQVITIIQPGEDGEGQTVVTIAPSEGEATAEQGQVHHAIEQVASSGETYTELATVKPEEPEKEGEESQGDGSEKRVPLKKRSVNSNGGTLDTVNVSEIQQGEVEGDKEGEGERIIIITTHVQNQENGAGEDGEAGGSQDPEGKGSQDASVYDFYEGEDDDAPVTTPSKDEKGDTPKRKKRQYQIPKFDDGRLIDHVFSRVKKAPPSPREPKTHECDICGRTFRTSTLLRNHHNTHTGTKPYKCELCQRAFGTSGELARHTKYIHTHEKPHKCPLCDYVSVESSKIKRHMRSHTGEKPFKCQLCSYASTDNYKLKRHMRVHTGEKPFKCPECDMAFSQKSSLKEHRWKHTGNRPTHKCDYCDVTFGRIADMKAHIRKMHTAGDPLICKVCENGFSDRFSYMQHIKTHRGEKIYKCGQCGYSCPQKRHLLTHMRVHTGERPFACKDCGESFKHKPTLVHHEKTKHDPNYQGEKDGEYSCEKCDKSFTRTSALKNHQKKHETILITTPETGEKRKAEESPEGAPSTPRKMTRSQTRLSQTTTEEGQVIHTIDPTTVSGIEGAVVDVQGIQGTVIGVDAEGGGLVIRVDSSAVGVVSTPEEEEKAEKEEIEAPQEIQEEEHHASQEEQLVAQISDLAQTGAAEPHPVAAAAAGAVAENVPMEQQVEQEGGAEEETEEGEGGTIYLFVEEQ